MIPGQASQGHVMRPCLEPSDQELCLFYCVWSLQQLYGVALIFIPFLDDDSNLMKGGEWEGDLYIYILYDIYVQSEHRIESQAKSGRLLLSQEEAHSPPQSS